jgi:hypothetical protein
MARQEEPTPKDRGGAVLSVRFTTAEMDRLRTEAERAGVPVSAFVRRFALTRQPTATWSANSTNASSDPNTTSGISAVGYNGLYAPSVGKNR